MEFPKPFVHSHEPLRNVNDILSEERSLGQKAADTIARVIGSWKFIIGQSLLLALWAFLNVVAWTRHWDPYPFILMNLFLSLQAAYTAPVIMMSQNRQAVRDRLEAHNDYQVNQKAEAEVRAILDHLAAQDRALTEIHRLLVELQTMGTEFAHIPATTTLEELEPKAQTCALPTNLVAAPDDGIVGWITRERVLATAARGQDPSTPIGHLAWQDYVVVDKEISLSEVMAQMQELEAAVALVSSQGEMRTDKQIRGVITKELVADYVGKATGWYNR